MGLLNFLSNNIFIFTSSFSEFKRIIFGAGLVCGLPGLRDRIS